MNVGFSNLTFLKSQLLAAALRGATDYDAQITTLGLGIAGQFERYCNRGFNRRPGYQEVLPADRCEFLLRMYPVETITLSEVKRDEACGFVAQTNQPRPFIRIIDYQNGIVDCGTVDIGEPWQQVRFTYTGGFFWEQLEPTTGGNPTPGYPTPVPPTSFALPADLLLAWVLQCKWTWQIFDPLNEKIAAEGSNGPRAIAQQVFGDLELLPAVKSMLEQFVRYQLT
jgi:hypothetical protein